MVLRIVQNYYVINERLLRPLKEFSYPKFCRSYSGFTAILLLQARNYFSAMALANGRFEVRQHRVMIAGSQRLRQGVEHATAAQRRRKLPVGQDKIHAIDGQAFAHKRVAEIVGMQLAEAVGVAGIQQALQGNTQEAVALQAKHAPEAG